MADHSQVCWRDVDLLAGRGQEMRLQVVYWQFEVVLFAEWNEELWCDVILLAGRDQELRLWWLY